MAIYEYIGVDAKGKSANGTVEAESDRAARLKLRRMGVFPTNLGPQGTVSQKMSLNMNVTFGGFFQRVKSQDIALMTRQLSALLEANIPLVDSLVALAEQVEQPKLKTILTQVKQKVTEGTKFSDALREYQSIFGEIYINMVAAGESSGALDVVMERLADFTEAQNKLRSKVIGAMIYPIIMSVVGFLMMTGLFVVVIPKIVSIFEDAKMTLPLPTKILIFISSTLANYWWLLILLGAGLVTWFRRFAKSPSGKAWLDERMLKLPIIGDLVRKIAISRFSRTLATMLSSGVPLLNALDIVKNILDNTVLKKVVEQTRDNVREGQSVAEPLKKSGQFPPLVTHMIGIGEKTGELEPMLERVANNYDDQVERALTSLTALLEPLMIVTMAAIVSFVVMSILIPMLKMNSIAGH